MTSPKSGPAGGEAGPEIRRDFYSGRFVLIAPGRSGRPNDFRTSRAPSSDRSRSSCPFCPGREKDTPPEVQALRDAASAPDAPGWRVRVVPNKFPALVREAGRGLGPDSPGTFESRPGFGRHEVVVDTPDHGREWADLPAGHIREVLGVFRNRLRILENEPGIRYVQVFKNRGAFAGASLRHPHTQILALPEVPQQVRDEISFLDREAREKGGCPVCRLIAAESTGLRLVRADPDFVALAPFASRFPYEIHVLPKRHAASFIETTDAELDGLAGMMKSVFARLRDAASDPDYHLVLRQAPASRPGDSDDARASAAVHWRFEILPVMGLVAGFEWGTGCFINPVPPETAAAALHASSDDR